MAELEAKGSQAGSQGKNQAVAKGDKMSKDYGQSDPGEMKEVFPFREGDEVDLTVKRFIEIGIVVEIAGRYSGLLYKDEVFQILNAGDQVRGFIKKIREDGKIDVTLRKGGLEEIEASKELVLKALRANRGFLPLGDSSPPELIREKLQMSKKTFKKALGGLYKDRVIELASDGIKLIRETDKRRRIGDFDF